MGDILELFGYESESAGTAEETLAHPALSEVSVAILDRRLPDALAEDLLPRLKQAPPDLDVIIVTGQADLDSTIAARRLGASDYLLKPVNPDALKVRIDRLVERKQLEREKHRSEAAFRNPVEAAGNSGGRAGHHRTSREAENVSCLVEPFVIRQVFLNILGNSLAACTGPVEITVRYEDASLDGQPAIRVALSDNGPGLTVEAREQAFDEFFTTRTRGTGLVICRRFVEAHRGRIEFGAADDGFPDPNSPGTTVLVTLPRA